MILPTLPLQTPDMNTVEMKWGKDRCILLYDLNDLQVKSLDLHVQIGLRPQEQPWPHGQISCVAGVIKLV